MPRRLNITLAVKRLVRDAARRLPELAHVRAAHLLVVAGEARRASRATISPAAEDRSGLRRHAIRIRGREIRYVVTLRPLWFVRSSPEERIDTILHELWHASSRFDGRLDRGRRHDRLPAARYGRLVRGMRERYVAAAPPEVLAPFAHHGLARARMWLERPPARRGARAGPRVYTELQLFYGVVVMRTGRRAARPAGGAAGR